MQKNEFYVHVLAVMLLINPLIAHAANTTLMLEGIPLLRILYVLFLSIWGGVARLLERLATGEEFKVNLKIVIARDMVVSSLAGILFFLLCTYYEVAPMLTAVVVTVSGYFGSRSLELIFNRFAKQVDSASVEKK